MNIIAKLTNQPPAPASGGHYAEAFFVITTEPLNLGKLPQEHSSWLLHNVPVRSTGLQTRWTHEPEGSDYILHNVPVQSLNLFCVIATLGGNLYYAS